MKILLLSTGGKIGGEETFTRNLALRLIELGHVVQVAIGGSIQKKDLESHDIEVAPIDITGRSLFKIFIGAKNLSKYIEENEFDIVHAQAVGPALMGVISKKLFHCSIPWIWHNHGISNFAYNHIVKYLDNLDLVISNSDYVYVTLRNHGISLEKSKRIHNGINVKDFSVSSDEQKIFEKNIHDEFDIPMKNKILIYVGRLSSEKGVEVFLKAFERVYSVHLNTSCIIVGDGIEKSNLLAQIEKYKSRENIYFIGFRKDIKELVAASNILILPSHIETFSLTSLQSFATGTPCIASDVGGTPEQILNDFNGYLFKDNDYSDLAMKIQYLLENEVIYDYIKKNAKKMSNSYLNSDRMINEIELVYKSLIEK